MDSAAHGQEPTGPSGFGDSPNRTSTRFEDTLPRIQMSPDRDSPGTSPRRPRPDMPTPGADDEVDSSPASRDTRLRPTEVALFGSRGVSDYLDGAGR